MSDHSPGLPGILAGLRAATAEAHTALEGTVRIEKCVLLQSDYLQLLKSFYGFYRPVESRLQELGGRWGAWLDWNIRAKLPWLEADLLALGLAASQFAELSLCEDLPAVTSSAQGFGCLYVLEGATLGGRQITALMRNSPVPVGARCFFRSYGTETGPRWKEFIAALEDCAQKSGEPDRAEIIQTAQQTFACLQRWIVARCPSHEHPG